MATQIVRIHFFLVSLQTNQSEEITAISTVVPNQNVFVNGTELANDQPVKISKIEVIENTKINQNLETETETKAESIVKDQLNASQLETLTKTVETNPSTTTTSNVGISATPKPENPEDSIVTPDYIQQSKLQQLNQIYGFHGISIISFNCFC